MEQTLRDELNKFYFVILNCSSSECMKLNEQKNKHLATVIIDLLETFDVSKAVHKAIFTIARKFLNDH